MRTLKRHVAVRASGNQWLLAVSCVLACGLFGCGDSGPGDSGSGDSGSGDNGSQDPKSGTNASAESQPGAVPPAEQSPQGAAATVVDAPKRSQAIRIQDTPDKEDVVFAAFGNMASSLEGARAVGASLGALAPEGPLDLVLLLGNVFGAKKVESIADPRLNELFEDLFPAALKLPFHFIAGSQETDYRGGALVEYGNFTSRFDYPAPVYSFAASCRGKTILFVGVDTRVITGSVMHPATRRYRTLVSHLLGVEADWRVVFASQLLEAGAALDGADGDAERTESAALLKILSGILADKKPDLWIGAGGNYSSVQTVGRLTQIQAGGGGGVQGAASARWTADTEWVGTGGGFVWCRFDGEGIDVSVRGMDGKPRFAKRLTK